MNPVAAFHPAVHTIVLSAMLLAPLSSQDQSLGQFLAHGDVGDVELKGSVAFDVREESYTLSGSGANMWFDDDQFHLLYVRLSGDFILRARAEFIGQGVNPHRKMGWMVRSDLSSDAAYVDLAVHGDGLAALQFRRGAGGQTEEVRSPVSMPDVLQLERKGHTFTMSVARFGEPLASGGSVHLDLGDDVYVGLFVCAHNPEIVERAVFRNVRMIVPAPDDFVPYQDYLASNLEILEVETGHRLILRRSQDAMQAPNWTPDGRALIYNENGLLYRFDLGTKNPERIDTGFAIRNNNDHALSFDGTRLAISHHSDEHGGDSIIYMLPVGGGQPTQVTGKGPSYLHGWSPDGQWLTYTGGRDGGYDIYKIPVQGGEEVRLTASEGLDDGSEYTPDGRYIYFNSERSGRMQIWRMRPDGSDQQQVTDDRFNNWFPHISPDGRWILFLSYRVEVDPGDHPWYKHVYLRLMPAEGGTPRVVAYVYGGQGTINVPSWSPDSKRVAFVSNGGWRTSPP